MTPNHDLDRRLADFYATEAPERAPEWVLASALTTIETTHQRRVLLRAPWRFGHMNTLTKALIAAAAVLVVLIAGYKLLPGNGVGTNPTPSPSPTASPMAFHNGSLAAGTYVTMPFAGANPGVCVPGIMPQCTENPADDSIQVTLTVPDGYTGSAPNLLFGPDKVPPPYSDNPQFFDGVLLVERGANLYSDPCHITPPPDVAVGPTVDDFANAIAAHSLLDATDPVDVTLAGYSGKYIDLQLPADVSGCDGQSFWPWEPGSYAQGNSHRWHLWILDVNGVRVVIRSMDWPTTTPQRQAEIRAIVDSIQITP